MSRKKSITKKGEKSTAKRYFWVGVILIITAGIIWVVNGAGGRMSWARADNDTGTSNASGHFSETWTASEMSGDVYAYDGWGGFGWVVATTRHTGYTNTQLGSCGLMDVNSVTSNRFTYWAVPGSQATIWKQGAAVCKTKDGSKVPTTDGSGKMTDKPTTNGPNGMLYGQNVNLQSPTNLVTEWTVNGHIH